MSITIDHSNFTPFSSLLGGALIGLSSSLFLVASGRIAGISGLLKVAVSPSANESDVGLKRAFIAGLVLSGTCASLFGFTHIPSMDLTKLLIGGILVGAGANLQHGCTSGHGVCGLSRKSPKSLVLVCTFMMSGVLTEAWVKVHILSLFSHLSTPTGVGETVSILAKSLFPILSVGGVLSSFMRHKRNPTVPTFGVFSGSLFGTGLVISGMSNPSKVVSFLDITGTWDPSLMFVMGGAILVSLYPFHYVQNKGKGKSGKGTGTYIFPRETFSTMKYLQPSSWTQHPAKFRSLVGAVLFGAGWSVSGMCPGPGLVLGGAGSSDAIIYIPAVIFGQWISDRV